MNKVNVLGSVINNNLLLILKIHSGSPVNRSINLLCSSITAETDCHILFKMPLVLFSNLILFIHILLKYLGIIYLNKNNSQIFFILKLNFHNLIHARGFEKPFIACFPWFWKPYFVFLNLPFHCENTGLFPVISDF